MANLTHPDQGSASFQQLQVLTVSMCLSHLAEVLCAAAVAAFIKTEVFPSSHKQRSVSQEDKNGGWNLPIRNHKF